MFNRFGKMCLAVTCFALLVPMVLHAAEEDDDEGPVNPKVKAAREQREQKAKLSREAPSDPSLPKDANSPIDINAFLNPKDGAKEGAKEKESAAPAAKEKEKEKSPGVGADLSQFEEKNNPPKDKTPAAPGAKDKGKTPPDKPAASNDPIDMKKFGEGANLNADVGGAGRGVCQGCQGQQIVPILPYVPFIKIHDSDPANNPEIVPAYKPCPICNAKFDVKQFLKDIKDHQEKASAKNSEIEKFIGIKLLQAENQYVSVRTSLTSKELRKIMGVVERLSSHLSSTFQSMTLLTSRPDEASIVFMTEGKQFDKLVDKIYTDGEHKDFAKKVRGCGYEGNHVTCLDAMDLQYESHAIFSYAKILIDSAANGHAPNWLSEGFGDYCEWAVLNKNQHYSIAYIADQKVKGFSANWVSQIRKMAQEGKVSPYSDLQHFDMIGMKATEYLSCMGVVCCLVKSSPRRFDHMIQFIRNGEDPQLAIEKAYGRKIKEMERYWVQWMAQPQW